MGGRCCGKFHRVARRKGEERLFFLVAHFAWWNTCNSDNKSLLSELFGLTSALLLEASHAARASIMVFFLQMEKDEADGLLRLEKHAKLVRAHCSCYFHM